MEIAGYFTFGRDGDGEQFLREGWSHNERDFSWTDGLESRLTLPVAPGTGVLQVELTVSPMLIKPMLKRQRIVVSANGTVLVDDVVGGQAAIGVEVPAELLGERDTIDLHLRTPDALIPSEMGVSTDGRRLGFALREILMIWTPPRPAFAPRRLPPLPHLSADQDAAVRGLTGLSIPELALCFESIGHNCEFGLAQRQMGVEPLGLLRFAGIAPHKLLEGLDLEFEGIDAPGNLMTYMEGDGPKHEIMVRDQRYGAILHSHMYDPDSTSEQVLSIFYRNLGFLRRKFVEDLKLGGKIFVYQFPSARSVAQIRPILTLLRSHGPNTLLYVTDDHRQPPGTVEQLDDDLLHGYVEKLAPTFEVTLLELPPWIAVCANAYRLWRLSGHGG